MGADRDSGGRGLSTRKGVAPVILRLGYSGPTPVVDYYGNARDPNQAPTLADCIPFQCGAQPSNVNAMIWCSSYGMAQSRPSCTDSACAPFKPAWCPSGAAVSAPAPPPVSAPVSPAAPTQPVQTSGPNAPPTDQGPPVTIQTPSGPIQVPAGQVPGVTDQTLTPINITIPNIWDSLDPNKVSQFAYRGLATTLPVWISLAFRQRLAARAAGSGAPGAPIVAPPAASGSFLDSLASSGGWIWLVILAALLLLRDKPVRHRAPKVRVSHGK